MSSTDWSAKGDEFKLAEAVLADDWSRSIEIMRRIGKTGPVSKIQYRDWPLFKTLRQQEIFLKEYEEIFGEPLGVQIANTTAKKPIETPEAVVHTVPSEMMLDVTKEDEDTNV